MGKDYQHIEDFLEDQSFRKWVLEKDDTEEKYWESWAKAHPDREQLLLQARVILLDVVPNINEWEQHRKASFLKRVDKSIENLPNPTRRSADIYRRGQPVSWPKMLVGSLLLLMVLAWLSHDTRFFDFQQENLVEELAVAEDVWITKSVPVGQKLKVHLSDGSIITLNSSSQIRYREGFGVKHREIFLDGEAFFDVALDSLLPFRVVAQDVVTTALGTSFNIQYYDDNEVRIQLATGRVEVHKHTENGDALDSGMLLDPGEEVLRLNPHALTKRKFDLETAFLWKDGVIYFYKTPFSEVITTLERWYGVKINIKRGSHNNPSVSGKFKNDYLTNVLETIRYTVEFDYQISGKEVNICFKNK